MYRQIYNDNQVLDVKIDIWETDSSGMYDVQHAGREKPDGRCILMSDEEGKFWFKGIVPVPYPIPHDGPVGKLLSKLNGHPMMIKQKGTTPRRLSRHIASTHEAKPHAFYV
ncbi:Intradiol ring-cleavage dioxygenase [Ilyonectria destructans]|nr:Intradiol ring-cleavage dioxygenase [Ilyonectria destructans]